MRSHEAVGPKWDAALVEPFFDLLGIGFEDAGSSNHNLKLAVHSAESGQYPPSPFADQLYGESSCFAFRGDTVFRETSRTQFACQRRWTRPVPDDFGFFRFFVNVLQIAIIDPLLAQFSEQENGQGGVEIAKRRGTNSILKHHALRKASGRVIAGQTRKGLNRVEIKFFFRDNLF